MNNLMIKEILTEHWVAILKNSMFVFLMIYFFNVYEEPSDPLVLKIQFLVAYFGIPLALLLLVINFYLEGQYQPIRVSIGTFIRKTINGMTSISVVLWAVGEFGSDIKVWIILNPDETIATVVSFTLIWLALRLSGINFYSPVNKYPIVGAKAGSATSIEPFYKTKQGEK